MPIITEILSRNGVLAPDRRPLHGYEITAEEQRRLREFLRHGVGRSASSIAQGFVLWASEHIRTRFAGGQLTWEFVFDGLGLPCDRDVAVRLTERGLGAWRRPLRRSEIGHREFLYSLLAEGGLPDLAIAQARTYRTVLLDLVVAIEAEGVLGASAAEAAALRGVDGLPQVMRSGEQARLLAALAVGLVRLRAALPAGLPQGAAESWLDTHRPGWRRDLPLRLSAEALEAVVRPALAAVRARPAPIAAMVLRQLRRSEGGGGWKAVAVLRESAQLARDMVPLDARGLILRLLTETGAAFRAVPCEDGWEMQRSSGRGPLVLALTPDQAVVLSAYADGRALGEVVLNPGLPSPSEGPSLWRPEDAAATEAEVLLPLSGRGQTRSAQVFALVAEGTVPEPGAGVTLGAPLLGPGGLVWPLAGEGQVQIGAHKIRLSTGAEAEAPVANLIVAHVRSVSGFSARDGVPVCLSRPTILGSEGNRPFVALGANARWRDLPRLLGGQCVDWVEEGTVLSRLRLVVMPQALRLRLRETGAGRLRMDAEGLEPGWHLHLTAGDGRSQGRAGADGMLTLDLTCSAAPGEVDLRLTDPSRGASLELFAPWPARVAVLLDHAGARLGANRLLSTAGLLGWRGLFPEAGGVMQLRLAQNGTPVAFAMAGTVRLAAHADLIARALALTRDPDGRVNLRLVSGGDQTYRLEVGRYDWIAQDGEAFGAVALAGTRLRAVCLDDPARRAETDGETPLDLGQWLGGDEGLWYVQGVHPERGVLRPFVWSVRPGPRKTREYRVARYAEEWHRLLGVPDDPGWAASWEVIAAVRAAGDASGLDQVAALTSVPAAATTLVLTAGRSDRGAALSLEGEAPLWWPLVTCADWAQAMRVARERLAARLKEAGMSVAEQDSILADHLARVAGEVVTQRPELAAHLGAAVAKTGVDEAVLRRTNQRSLSPVSNAAARKMLILDAQDAMKRFDRLPEGIAGLRAQRLTIDHQYSDGIAPLLQAPLVAAEVAAGLRAKPTTQEVLQMIALRAADSVWFDRALPLALSLAMELRR